MTMPERQYVLLFSCENRKGIVAATASSLAAQGCDILENAQFVDEGVNRFFMRVKFSCPADLGPGRFAEHFEPVATAWRLDWKLHDLAVKARALIMVSKGGHCLNDLLYRTGNRQAADDDHQRRLEPRDLAGDGSSTKASRSTTCRSRPRPRPRRRPRCST